MIDFGIARALEEASLTATGVVVDTPGYLSPERITGTPIGPPSDVFALGAVLVFAASGHGPFAHGHAASLLHRVLHEQPQLPPLPDPLQDVVRRCLARDPAHRLTLPEILHLLGSPANTVLLNPPDQTIPDPTKLFPEGPIQPPQPPRQQQPGPTGATFKTSRTRPAIIAAITTVLYFGLQGYKQATVPWTAVNRLRVGGHVRRPWLIAWLEPSYDSTLPAPGRGHHGGVRIYPMAHGATVNRRIRPGRRTPSRPQLVRRPPARQLVLALTQVAVTTAYAASTCSCPEPRGQQDQTAPTGPVFREPQIGR